MVLLFNLEYNNNNRWFMWVYKFFVENLMCMLFLFIYIIKVVRIGVSLLVWFVNRMWMFMVVIIVKGGGNEESLRV